MTFLLVGYIYLKTVNKLINFQCSQKAGSAPTTCSKSKLTSFHDIQCKTTYDTSVSKKAFSR